MFLRLVEFLIRRLYFSLPWLEAKYQRYKVRTLKHRSGGGTWDPVSLKNLLHDSLPAGADIMLHASVAGLGPGTSPLDVLGMFREFCGDDRTLLLPTHPSLHTAADGVLEYDPRRSPSSVGLISELARRTPGFLRSQHPFSSVTASGPRAAEYFDNNLNDHKPLPHGVFSPYARLSEWGGYAVCLGVSFHKALSMIHVSEETLDDEFPLRIQFDEIRVRVGTAQEKAECVVRCRSMKMAPYTSMWSIKRDLLACGAVQSKTIKGITVNIVDCKLVVAFMRTRALESGYPYMFLPKKDS